MTNKALSFTLFALILIASSSPGLGRDICTREPLPTVAELDVGRTAIAFYPLLEFDRLILTVTGPAEFVYEQQVTRGAPVFKLSDETIDGCYSFELRVIPFFDEEILGILKESRESGDSSQVQRLRREGRLPSEAVTQSGAFKVRKGVIVLTDDIEKSDTDYDVPPNKLIDGNDFGTGELLMSAAAGPRIPTKDFVINDDLIVDGSACIGFDCVNGELFGFDTIRLKEHNLRIKFDDTSTAASFPRNDWQLTANDSANGGASKFSIDDISGGRTPFTVEANARTHSLYVDDGGRIGSRTSTPSTEIHTIDGDTPTLRLQQDGSSGFAPQTWDVAGNETNFFIRDVTNGSTLPFRIRPSAPTSSIFIDVDGDVGMGTSSPDADLDIDAGSSEPGNFRVSGDSAGFDLEDLNGATDRKVAQQFVDAGLWRLRGLNDSFTGETVTGIALDLSNGRVGIGNASSLGHPLVVGTNGTDGNGAHVTAGGVWTNGSSRALKEGINALSANEAMAALLALEPVHFRYTLEPNEDYVGFIAEDVPDLVATSDHQHLSPMDIVAVLTKVVQEQQKTIDELRTEIRAIADGSDD